MEKHIMKTQNKFVVVGFLTTVMFINAGSARADTWTRKANMPTARLGPKAEVVNGKIYVISGVYANLRKVEEYDPATDTWAAKADLPTSRALSVTGTVNGKIYVIGGEGSLGGSARATVEEYDPVTDTWTRKADMPTPRTRASASVVDGKIYVFGGASGGGSGYPEMSTVEAYDPATDTWARKADMPAPRELLATSVVGGKIYAICGQREDGTHRDVYPTVDMYDPATDTWTKKADAPLPRKVHSACVLNDIIYVFGGRNVIGGWPQSTLFQYDPAADTWAALEDMPYEVAVAPASTVDGRIYLIGGSSTWPPNQVLSTVWEYDPNPLVVDFNGDEIVNFKDFSMLAQYWYRDDSPFVNHRMDYEYLAGFVEHWLEDFRLVEHWQLDETEGIIAYDSVGENDGTLNGDPNWQRADGQIDGALQFDGIDDYVSAGFALGPADLSLSVFAWIKGGAPGQVIISQPDRRVGRFIEPGSTWLGTDPADGRLMTKLLDPLFGPLESDSVITDGQWHHVGLVYDFDGFHRRLYVDGAEVAKDTDVVAGLQSSDGGLYFGAGKDLDVGSLFSGLIDDIRIYNQALSAKEIEEMAR
jgi:N-acetylneuraminic acid mutarotase